MQIVCQSSRPALTFSSATGRFFHMRRESLTTFQSSDGNRHVGSVTTFGSAHAADRLNAETSMRISVSQDVLTSRASTFECSRLLSS